MLAVNRLAKLVVISSILSGYTYANERPSLSELIEQKQYIKAYEKAQQTIEADIGEPSFDYYLGLAAYHTERYQEAVFAFERVVLTNADNLSAKTYLAFSYFQVNNYDAAMVELNKLQNLRLSAQEQQQIQTYIEQIQQIKSVTQTQSSHSYKLAVQYAHDSNVNSGSSLDKVIIPVLGEIELFAGSKKISDNYQSVRANYNYLHRLNQNDALRVDLDISHLKHDKASFLDRTIPSVSVAYSTQKQDINYQLSSYIQPMQLDQDLYRVAYGLVGSISFPFSQGWLWQGSVARSEIDNKLSDNLDLQQLSMSYKVIKTGKHPHVFELNYAEDDATLDDAQHLSKVNTAARYQYIYNVDQKHKVHFGLSYLDSQYAAINPTTGIQRHDKLWSTEMSYNYQFSPVWSVNLLTRHSDKKSNTALYQHNRTEAILTLSYAQK